MSADHRTMPTEPSPAFDPARPGTVISATKALAARNDPDEILRLAGTLVPTNPDLADWMLRVATKALPQNPALIAALCNLPEQNGDVAKSAIRWTQLRRQSPRCTDGHVGYVELMIRHHRLDEADRALRSALVVVSDQGKLKMLEARLAELQGQWSLAAQRWELLARDRADEFPDAAANQQNAEREALLHPNAQASATSPMPPVPKIAKEDAHEVKKLLIKFESLGYNCELGLLQRKYGAEPLGLLRFASTQPQTLVSMLKSRFAGLGEPQHMRLKVTQGKYGLSHAFSSWTMHTGVRATPETDVEKLLTTQCKHTVFLRKKLLSDLEKTTKILAYQKSDLSDELIDRLYRAVQAIGPNMLMCVRLFDHDHPPGTIEWRAERLMVASLDKIGDANPGTGWDISVDYWVYFCRAALERWTTLRAEQPSTAQA